MKETKLNKNTKTDIMIVLVLFLVLTAIIFFPFIIGVARVFSGGVYFFLEKLTTFFGRRPHNTGQKFLS